MRRPLCSVILVNWNTRPELERCLTSFRRHARRVSTQILVIDNASEDGSREWLARQKGLEVILNPRNRGFAPAVNQGLARARGRYTLLLNSDVTLKSDALSPLIRFLRAHPKAGAAGAAFFYPDGRPQPHVRPFPTMWMAFNSLTALDRLFPDCFPSAETWMHRFDGTKTQTCDQVGATYMLMPTALLRDLGGMDEGQFILYNDVDICERLWMSGHPVWYVSTVRVFHEGSVSTRRAGPILRLRMYFDILRYFVRKSGWMAVPALAPVLLLRWAMVVIRNILRKGS